MIPERGIVPVCRRPQGRVPYAGTVPQPVIDDLDHRSLDAEHLADEPERAPPSDHQAAH